MKKRFLVSVVALLICLGVNGAYAAVTINWGYLDDLTANITPPSQDGWWVALYKDTSGDTTLSSVTFNQVTVTPTGVGNSSDDVFQGAIHESITAGYWNNTIADFSTVAGAKVYTVLFDAATTNAATSSIVLDTTEFTVPADPGAGTYAIGPPVPNAWQAMVAVPEPFTGVLFGLGLAVVAVARKRRN